MEKYLKGLDYEILQKSEDHNGIYKQMNYDSRKIKKDDVFVAMSGAVTDGHDYIRNAYENGAKCILVERKVPLEFPITYILVKDLRKHLGKISSEFYGWPQKKLKIIGITGTNGKTSSTYFLEKIIGEEKVARIGTIEYKVGKKIVEANNTTPESLDIVKICKEAADKGIEYLVMEVSSHALALGRVDMLDFEIGIFTNLTQDHLDFHKTMENYFLAKRELFLKLKNKKNSVINIDDTYGKRLQDEFHGTTYSIDNDSDIKGKILDVHSDGQEVEINIEGDIQKFKSRLLGKFNLYNILDVIGAAKLLGIPDSKIIEVVKSLHGAPGRYELVNCKSDFSVVVDYSHTEDSLENILKSLNELKKGRIITVFGCGGDRDRTKRPKMGKVAEDMSDIAIVTSDNPRTEVPGEIIKEILKGLKKENHLVIEDREKAIMEAIKMARPKDIVLIAGKGHETYQVVGREKYHFDDRDIACREMVRKKQEVK